MAIIVFESNTKKETGKTVSMAAIATRMAVEYNNKILIMSTYHNDDTLDRCFFKENKKDKRIEAQIAMETGMIGLQKIILSNKLEPRIISDYTETIFKGRLEIIKSIPKNTHERYLKIAETYKTLINVASQAYDYIFIDISDDIPYKEEIMKSANLIVNSQLQNLEMMTNFVAKLKTTNKKNMMISINRYDKESKYNLKNIDRFIKSKTKKAVPIVYVPYNIKFAEYCNEGLLADYILKISGVTYGRDKDFQAILLNSADLIRKRIIELQRIV